MTTIKMRNHQLFTWREHPLSSLTVLLVHPSPFASVAITTGNTFRPSEISEDLILVCQTCLSSPPTCPRTTFHLLPNRLRNPTARHVRVQALPLPQSSPLFPSRRQ